MGPLSLAVVVLAVLGGTWSTPHSVVYPCGCDRDCCCPYKAMEEWLIRTITAECSCECRCECANLCYQEIIDTYGCECRECCDADYICFHKLMHGTECGCSTVDIQAVFHYLCYDVNEDVVDRECCDGLQLSCCGCADTQYQDLLKLVKCYGICISDEECRKYFEVQCDYDHVSLERCDCECDGYEDMVMDIPELLRAMGYCQCDCSEEYDYLYCAMQKYVACHPEDCPCLCDLIKIDKEIQCCKYCEADLTHVLSTIEVDDVMAEDYMCYYVWVLKSNPELCCYKEEEMKKYCSWKYDVIYALECKTCVSAPAYIDWAQRMEAIMECHTNHPCRDLCIWTYTLMELDRLDGSDRCAFCCWQDEFEKRIQCEEFYCEFRKWCDKMDCEYRQKYGKGLCELWPYIRALCNEVHCQCCGYCSGFAGVEEAMYCDLEYKTRVDCESYLRQMKILCEELQHKQECHMEDYYHYEYMLRTGFMNDTRDDICSYKTLKCAVIHDTNCKLENYIAEYRCQREIKAAELKCKIAEMLYEWMLRCKDQEERCHCETKELYCNYIYRREEVTKKALYEMLQIYKCMVATQDELECQFEYELCRKQECCCHGKKELAATLKCELQQTLIDYDVWKQCAGGSLRECMKKTLTECMVYKNTLACHMMGDLEKNMKYYMDWRCYMMCDLKKFLCGAYEKHCTWKRMVEEKLCYNLIQELYDYLRIKQEVRVKCEQKQLEFQAACRWAHCLGEELKCKMGDNVAYFWIICKCLYEMRESLTCPDFNYHCWQAEVEEMCRCSCYDSLKEYYDWKQELECLVYCHTGMCLDVFMEHVMCHGYEMQRCTGDCMALYWTFAGYMGYYGMQCPCYDIRGIDQCCGYNCKCIEYTVITTPSECQSVEDEVITSYVEVCDECECEACECEEYNICDEDDDDDDDDGCDYKEKGHKGPKHGKGHKGHGKKKGHKCHDDHDDHKCHDDHDDHKCHEHKDGHKGPGSKKGKKGAGHHGHDCDD